jgi:ubiquinone biosynthesis protein COQ4
MFTSQTTGTRLQPFTAMRAIRTLFATRDTRQVFILLRAMRGRSGIRNFRRFAASPVGKTVLRDRRDLLPLLEDHARLGQLPAGSIGRAYLDFMESEDLSAKTLVTASENWEEEAATPDMALFRARMRELHDVNHVVTGYGRDRLGELCLMTFMYRQTGNLGMLMLVVMAWRRLPQTARAAVREAWRHGRKAAWLAEQDWEALLTRALADVRKMLRIEMPVKYRHAFQTLSIG